MPDNIEITEITEEWLEPEFWIPRLEFAKKKLRSQERFIIWLIGGEDIHTLPALRLMWDPYRSLSIRVNSYNQNQNESVGVSCKYTPSNWQIQRDSLVEAIIESVLTNFADAIQDL